MKTKYLLEITSKIYVNEEGVKGEVLIDSYQNLTLWKNIDLWINIFDLVYEEMLESKKE